MGTITKLTKAECGQRGGRPRALTIEDVRQRQLLEAQENKKEGMDTLDGMALAGLKRLWKRQRSNGSKNTKGSDCLTPAITPEGS